MKMVQLAGRKINSTVPWLPHKPSPSHPRLLQRKKQSQKCVCAATNLHDMNLHSRSYPKGIQIALVQQTGTS